MTLTRPGWRAKLTPGWLLRAALAHRRAIVAPLDRDWHRELGVIRTVRADVPLLMNDAAALQIMICVRAVRALDGVMAEAGVLKGGSARLICEAKGDVPLHLFDVFETLQPATRTVAGGEVGAHFGPVHGSRAEVERLLAPYPSVHLHPGLFPASVGAGIEDARFSFVHLDMDLPQSTRDGLAFFHPRLVPGGILIGDDYEDRDVRQVFGSYFAPLPDTVVPLPWGQVMVIRQG